MHFQHILCLVMMHCGRFRVLKYPCSTVNLALSLSIQLGRVSLSCVYIPLTYTFHHFYLPKSLSHQLPFSFISIILFHCLHEQVDKDVRTSPPNPMKEGVKEPKHKHETVTSEFLKLKKSESVRQSFGVPGNVVWKWGTAACFEIDLLITRWLYVPPFSKPSDHITRAIGQRWGAVNGLHRVQHPM